MLRFNRSPWFISQDYLYNDVEYRNTSQTPGEEILKQVKISIQFHPEPTLTIRQKENNS